MPKKTLQSNRSSIWDDNTNISVSKADLKDAVKKRRHGGYDNMLLSNCDSWSKVHCHQLPRSRLTQLQYRSMMGFEDQGS